jgi:enediyne biosynthesis protein E4
MFRQRLLAFAVLMSLSACGDQGRRVFELLPASETGITFANTITTNDSVNIQTDVYVYNGAGVAVGDINNDGLPDIFFSGNMVSSRLYLNKGHMQFEDITEKAGVGTHTWATGVTMVDVNNDGWLDIYVAVSGPRWSKPEDRRNLLFLNNRDGTFTECAGAYGIAETGFTSQAAWLDYNGDGWLDLFLLDNSPEDFSRGDVTSHPSGMATTPESFNQLFRNNGNGTFTNVSEQAGILRDPGYGLGVVIADVNNDGRPDIYISNDVTPNDVLYINNGNGTFTNRAAQSIKHASFSGMGVDIADFNNDGWPDIVQADMMPPDLNHRKRVIGFQTYSTLEESRARGFREDYSINSLQLSNGLTNSGDVVFSEIGRMAGISRTDWSWSALFADFDNDGEKDIFISNGYPKAVNDLDYYGAAFAARRHSNTQRALALLKELPGYHVPNYVFRNNGDLTFTDETRAWGMNQPSYSYGAAYADLDNDGKLDLVVNNIDAPAFIYHNVTPTDEAHHFIGVRLIGDAPNTRAVGARVAISARGQKQFLYYSPYRGYMSMMDERAHFGLGKAARVDSLEVYWSDGRYQLLTGLDADRYVDVRQSAATARRTTDAELKPTAQVFQQLAPPLVPAYKQQVGTLIDYSVQSLLPYMISRQGPPLAVADVNGDGLEDLYVGGGAGVAGKLFLQQKTGSFVAATGGPWEADSAFDDWGALFFDANGDGRPDLYVASGNYQLFPDAPLLQDRLYLNVGGGKFVRDARALPTMLTSTGVVRAADFNGDGKLDLFVGGRLTPRTYPYPTRSYILRNDGDHFTDVTEQVAPELVRPGGMITDALWIDFDGDKRPDLVTAGEWMSLEFYHNDGTKLVNVTAKTHLPPMRGWWYGLAAADFDHDGRPDIIAGNLGLNYTYTTSKDSRFGVYAADFAGNQTTMVVFAQDSAGVEMPLNGLAALGRDMYTLSIRYPTYGTFAQASMPQLFTPAQLEHALHYETDTFASMYLHNEGNGVFTANPLPTAAQISPIKGIIPYDVDGDGNLDLIVAGNLYDAEPNTPRADAGNGLWLRGDGKGHFTPVSPRASGFLAPKNVAGLALIDTPNGKTVIVANTGDTLQAFSVRKR